MVTVTAPSRAKARPSYQGLAGEPEKKPPPWIHTSTGSPAAPGSGVTTLTLSVPSPGMLGSGMRVIPGSPRCAVAPNAPASLVPSHAATRTGAPKRRSPTGGSANGMPRNAAERLPSAAVRQRPRTRPAVIRISGSLCTV